MVPDHVPLGVSSMKLPPVPTGLFYHSLLHQHCTKQHESSVGLQNHQTRSDWLFFLYFIMWHWHFLAVQGLCDL